jgi:hypothetical protein
MVMRGLISCQKANPLLLIGRRPLIAVISIPKLKSVQVKLTKLS